MIDLVLCRAGSVYVFLGQIQTQAASSEVMLTVSIFTRLLIVARVPTLHRYDRSRSTVGHIDRGSVVMICWHAMGACDETMLTPLDGLAGVSRVPTNPTQIGHRSRDFRHLGLPATMEVALFLAFSPLNSRLLNPISLENDFFFLHYFF